MWCEWVEWRVFGFHKYLRVGLCVAHRWVFRAGIDPKVQETKPMAKHFPILFVLASNVGVRDVVEMHCFVDELCFMRVDWIGTADLVKLYCCIGQSTVGPICGCVGYNHGCVGYSNSVAAVCTNIIEIITFVQHFQRQMFADFRTTNGFVFAQYFNGRAQIKAQGQI